MNTANSQPTVKALENAKRVYSSPLVKEVYENGFQPTDMVNHFGVSVLVQRGNIQTLVDYTFTKKTGKLVKSETVETIFND